MTEYREFKILTAHFLCARVRSKSDMYSNVREGKKNPNIRNAYATISVIEFDNVCAVHTKCTI